MNATSTVRLHGHRIAFAGVSATLFVLLARRVSRTPPPDIDLRARRIARRMRQPLLSAVLAPIDPIGYPVAYIPVAHLCSLWLRRRGVRHASDVAATVWATWLAHRAFKLFHERQRPPRGARAKHWKPDSYPSGHTAGAAGFSAALADVLYRDGRITRGEALALGVLPPVVVGASRVYEDMHWLTDVIGGVLLGAAMTFSLATFVDEGRSRYGLNAPPRRRRPHVPAPA